MAFLVSQSRSGNEIELFKNSCLESDILLEWGSGASTIYFSSYVKEYYSIEHDANWYDKIEKEIEIRNIKNVHYQLVAPTKQSLHSDYTQAKTTKVRNYKYPNQNFNNYVEYVHKLPCKKYDIVLIDGRARDFCLKEVIPYLTTNTKVFIHDYGYKNRSHYEKMAKKYYTVEKVVDNLALLKLKTVK